MNGFSGRSTIDLTGVPERLVSLKRLIVPGLQLSPKQALELIPPSTTLIDVALVSQGNEYVGEIMENIAPKLVRFYDSLWYEMEEMMTLKAFDPGFANLKVVSLKVPQLLYLPPSVTSVTLESSRNLKRIPEHVQEFVLRNQFPPDVGVLWSPSHRLRSLTWYSDLPLANWFEHLPDTIEKLDVPFDLKTWRSLNQFLCSTSRLPLLASLRSNTLMDVSILELLAPRLRKVHVQLSVDKDSIPASVLTSLSCSNLDNFKIQLRVNRVRVIALQMVVSFLNHLPKKLRTLDFSSPCILSPLWPVTLPSTLTSAFFGVCGFEHQYPNHEDAPRGTFEFPSSLTQLSIAKSAHNFFLGTLPPYLSLAPNFHIRLESDPTPLPLPGQLLPPSPRQKVLRMDYIPCPEPF